MTQEQSALEMQKELLEVLQKHNCIDFFFVAGFRNSENTYVHGIVGKPSILLDIMQDCIERNHEAQFIFENIEL